MTWLVYITQIEAISVIFILILTPAVSTTLLRINCNFYDDIYIVLPELLPWRQLMSLVRLLTVRLIPRVNFLSKSIRPKLI
jgi:hypothetical protein